MRAVTPNSGQQTIVPHVRMQGVEGLDGGTTALQLPKGDTLTLSAEQQGLSRSAQRHHQLVSLAQKQPEVVAQVIQVWLNEENSRRRA
jgi:flagellar biosynthesis/type III secretory pathway M-ring protein FliF/YscJ